MIEFDIFTKRQEMMELFKSGNPGAIIIKFGAEWCAPCKKIDSFVDKYMEMMPSDKIRCIKIDIDNALDVYAFLKSKKIVNGIPVCLAYYKGNTHFVPDNVVIGTNTDEIKMFFEECYNHV